MRRAITSLLAADGLHEVGEMRTLHALLVHPQIARIHGEVVARGAGADHHHAAALAPPGPRPGKVDFARMLEHHVDVVALAGEGPDRLAELARVLQPVIVFRRADLAASGPSI